MNYKRILRHLSFWTVYLAVTLFTSLYLSASFQQHPSLELLGMQVKVMAMILCLKVAAVYYLLYAWIPALQRTGFTLRRVAEVVLAFALLLVMYRLLMHYVVWPYITGESPGPIPFSGQVARVFYSLFDLAEVAAVAVAIKLYRLRVEALRRERELIREKLHSEILHLKAQINPHFLFNSLNTIFSLSRQQSAQTSEAVMQLSQILRFMLYESEKKLTTIGQEMKIISDYIALQRMRFGSKVQVVQSVDIDNPSGPLAPLLLFPLVENAFKHGVGTEGENSEIILSVTLHMGILKVQVRNGVSPESVPRKGEAGIGLASVRRQLELLYRDFEFRHGAASGVFTVDLQIDTQTYAGTELFDHRG